MRWILYNVLFTIGYLAMLPSFYRRMKKRGGYRAHFNDRFGKYDAATLAALRERKRLWIHAVSVGEAYVAGRILDAVRARDPSVSIVLSTTSSTGYKVCQGLVREGDVLIYFPIDFPWCVRRALDAVAPSSVVLTESELWPNFLRQCHKRGIPVTLMNGRVSDRSFPRYKALRFFFGPVLQTFREIQVQFDTDRDRMIAMGAPADRIRVVGTVKFDIAKPDAAKVASIRKDLDALWGVPGPSTESRPTILLGASTWPGEEKLLLDLTRELLPRIPSLRLLLIPRHQERGDEVEALVRSAGFPCFRRSRDRVGDVPPEGPRSGAQLPPVLLADTTGELFAFHTVADVTFVGKTLPPSSGAQNMIEPCALGKPVVVGPNTENFAGPMSILLAGRAILQAPDADGVRADLSSLLLDPKARAALGRVAAETVASASGALPRGVATLPL